MRGVRGLSRVIILFGTLCLALLGAPALAVEARNGVLTNAPEDKAYVGVRLQQGRVETDSDWNENVSVWVLSDWVAVLTDTPSHDVKTCSD